VTGPIGRRGDTLLETGVIFRTIVMNACNPGRDACSK